jgi:hypothetical protein
MKTVSNLLFFHRKNNFLSIISDGIEFTNYGLVPVGFLNNLSKKIYP